MTEQAVPAGPPCDICHDEFAAMSLLSFGDYSQVKAGLNCAPDFLRSVADSMDGKHTAEPDTGPDTPEPDPYESSAGSEPDTEPDPPDGDDGQGSASDHWASTRKVVRSTHGHRRPSSATGGPRKDDPE